MKRTTVKISDGHVVYSVNYDVEDSDTCSGIYISIKI